MEIVIYGDHGEGKTTVALAIRNMLRDHGLSVRFIEPDADLFADPGEVSDDLRVMSSYQDRVVAIETAVSRAAWERRLEELDGPVEWDVDHNEFDEYLEMEGVA